MKKKFYLKMVSLVTVLVLTGCGKAVEVKLKHFYEEDVEMITDLSPEEQKCILDLFSICVPSSETNAYINSFQKYYYGNNIYAYVVEFDGVDSYRNFYEANAERIGKNGLPDVSCNQFESVSLELLHNGDLSDTGDGNTDYYLTYQILIHKSEEQKIPELYEEYSSKRQ